MTTADLPWTFHADDTLPGAGEVFVFGSNLAGRHGKGAALAAKRAYGAVTGKGQGLMGQPKGPGWSYAIPTKDEDIQTLPLPAVIAGVRAFVAFAHQRPEMHFFVTRVGCGLAGYRDSAIALLFVKAPSSCSFPQAWEPHLRAALEAFHVAAEVEAATAVSQAFGIPAQPSQLSLFGDGPAAAPLKSARRP